MPRRAILCVIAWICLTCAVAAEVPSFPALTGRVVDEAGLLTATDRAALTESLAAFETKTKDQLVIVTVKSLQGTPIEDYGYQLGRHWQIGQKDKNTGALLIVATTEHRVRIEVGYGLEGTLTDALTKVIIENSILPKFKTGDFAGGIKSGTQDIIRVLSGDAETIQSAAERNVAMDVKQTKTDMPVWVAIVAVLAVVGLLVLCTVTGGGGVCQAIWMMVLLLLSGGRGSSRGSSFGGGGGSFGGGGSSGKW
ncbi:TPM domain-containing protein [Telmatospirillum siberiense]|uniref:Methanol dehydrogenase n=1 Tax=Telmatospirillum siberiense TaxID=382514 RepID=A0A2N3Q172_9PROT|nr:TPM domain-containing protein [Telmatospirillum siberiense]PKU26341.1 methanol dehydrogenase [Telmatospirillum siberiense]